MSTLASYMNAQFSALQDLEFFSRIVVAALCGACIGVERSKRLKEAGMRTHVIVCFASALMMIVSKYGFADMLGADGTDFPGIRGADSSRIAAQVVSGVSFLGAGVIFKNGNMIRGLTTAAGLWATAGIGLAVGAGMYVLGIVSTITMAVLQILMHRFAIGADTMIMYELKFSISDNGRFRDAFADYAANRKFQIMESKVTREEDGDLSYDLIIKTPQDVTIHDLDAFLRANGEVRHASYSTIS